MPDDTIIIIIFALTIKYNLRNSWKIDHFIICTSIFFPS